MENAINADISAVPTDTPMATPTIVPPEKPDDELDALDDCEACEPAELVESEVLKSDDELDVTDDGEVCELAVLDELGVLVGVFVAVPEQFVVNTTEHDFFEALMLTLAGARSARTHSSHTGH